jgi:hypothetical protein
VTAPRNTCLALWARQAAARAPRVSPSAACCRQHHRAWAMIASRERQRIAVAVAIVAVRGAGTGPLESARPRGNTSAHCCPEGMVRSGAVGGAPVCFMVASVSMRVSMSLLMMRVFISISIASSISAHRFEDVIAYLRPHGMQAHCDNNNSNII